jgi:hypothetical protein
MNILKKPIFWIVVGGVVFTALILILIPLTFPTVRTINDPQAEEVFARFKTRIGTTPAGQHYLELISRHDAELNEIYDGHEEHRQNLLRLTQVFEPVMQDLVEGDGNKVQITQEQIDLLQSELDWIARQASPALRRDIEEEWQHFQLDIFAGMTLSEAMDVLAADLPPEVAAQPIQPTALPTLVIPTQVVPTLVQSVCSIGLQFDCLAEPSIVPGSNGLWAYALLDGLYFEHPTDWRVMTTKTSFDTRYFLMPPQETMDELKTQGMFISVIENGLSVELPPVENPLWEEQLSLPGLDGQEYMFYTSTDKKYVFQAHLYDQDHGRLLRFEEGIYVQQTDASATSEIMQENISRFRHVVESFKIWNEGQPVLPTAVGTPLVVEGGFAIPSAESAWITEIMNGVSFEYPVEWQMKASEYDHLQIRSFIVPAGSFEELHTKATIIGMIQNVTIPQDAPLDKLSCAPDITNFPQPASIWHEPVILDDFEGSQFLWEGINENGALLHWEVVLYNREFQRMFCMATQIYPDANGQLAGTLEMARANFPNFYHMLESIKLVDE